MIVCVTLYRSGCSQTTNVFSKRSCVRWHKWLKDWIVLWFICLLPCVLSSNNWSCMLRYTGADAARRQPSSAREAAWGSASGRQTGLFCDPVVYSLVSQERQRAVPAARSLQCRPAVPSYPQSSGFYYFHLNYIVKHIYIVHQIIVWSLTFYFIVPIVSISIIALQYFLAITTIFLQ